MLPNQKPKIFIQNTNTSFYFKKIGEWTGDPDAAFDFERTHVAVRFCQVNQMPDVQVISWLGEGMTDFMMKVPPGNS